MRSYASVLIALALLPVCAYAGRPLATDDASMLEAGACQLELWIDRKREAREVWAAPACNFGGNVEWQVAGARTFEHGRGALSAALVQAKTVLRSVDDNPWGIGLVAGATRLPRRETETGWGDPYLIVPVSFKFGEADNLIHANIGWLRNRADDRNLTLWGLAFEAPLTDSFTLLGETYGENSRNPFFRAGGRLNAIKDRLDFDLTYVTRQGGTRAERFLSLGLYYKTK